jgi:hypothetical protein
VLKADREGQGDTRAHWNKERAWEGNSSRTRKQKLSVWLRKAATLERPHTLDSTYSAAGITVGLKICFVCLVKFCVYELCSTLE